VETRSREDVDLGAEMGEEGVPAWSGGGRGRRGMGAATQRRRCRARRKGRWKETAGVGFRPDGVFI
jgi:hypothetical protein